MAIDTQQNTGVIRHFKAREHIGGSGTAGQDITLCLLLQFGTDLKEGHNTAQSLFLLEPTITQVHIHGLEHIDHLLLTPQKLFIGFCRDRHEHRHVEQILIVVCYAIFDVIACLNGVGQFLIVGTGVMHALQFGAVQTNALRNLIDRLTSVFSGEVDINIDAFTGIDEAGHPTTTNGTGITVSFDIEETVVPAIHDDVVVMGQIQTSGGNKMTDRDMRDRIDSYDLSLGSHGVNDDPVDAIGEGFIHTGSTVEEHIQDLSYRLIGILGLDNVISALHEVSAGILLRADQHTKDLGVIIRFISADRFILINQKEAPGQRFSGAHILNQSDVIFSHGFALFVILLRKLLPNQSNMLVGVGLSGNGLELQLHGRDLQPAGEG